MSGDIYENTPSGRSAALAAVDNDESRLWIDGPVIRILDMIEDVSSGQGQKSSFSGPVRTGIAVKAALPTASGSANALMTVSDPAAGKGRLVYSDGAVWRYVSDDSTV